MKSLLVLSVLFSAFSLSIDVATADVHPEARERIQKLVVERLQQRTLFWRASAFSRAIIPVEAPELRLWTSRPVTDLSDRAFVPFRIEEAQREGVTFTGCYYPGTDAAFIHFEGLEAPVPIDEHPWLTLRAPATSTDATLCRERDQD